MYSNSERLVRKYEEGDQEFCSRIAALLNHPDIDTYCMVDAFYYDNSVIPQEIIDKHNCYRDMYLIYGITTKGEIISKWVERWDLDSDGPILDGKVIQEENKSKNGCASILISYSNLPPPITQHFSNDLLAETKIPKTVVMRRFSEKHDL